MIRRFFTVRWVTIHLLTIAIVIVFVLFGRWQLHRWEGRGTSVIPPDNRPAVALATLDPPDEPLPGGAIGRRTTATGRFDGAHQVLIADRQLAGRNGYWVVTPLRPDSGSAALVVRGWVASPDDPALRVPDTRVTVSGRVYASEDPPPVGTGSTTPLPAGQYREVNTAELTAAFPYRILDGYVQLAATDPALAAPTPTVLPVPVRTEDNGGGLRNLAYSIQWILFALAVLYFWGKLVREDLAPPEEREYQRSDRADEDGARVPAQSPEQAPGAPAATEPVGAAEPEPEDDELAAYNRYLADLNARSSRSRS